MIEQSSAPRGNLHGIAAGAAEIVSTIDQAGDSHERPTLSVIVPTKNEAGNIERLVERLESVLPSREIELIFVDDSDDDTVTVIQRVQQSSKQKIVLIHRPPDQRADGLGGAVVAGLRAVQARWVCVMDGDLQHPPELVPQLLDAARCGGADLVIASRYCDRGHADGLNCARSAISQSFTLSAKLMFPKRLGGVSDPMSGFFLLRKESIQVDSLHPRGFKILLEIMVRTPNLRIAEVGFEFGKRHAGQSKASIREGMTYLSHLCRLRFSTESLSFIRFLMVGLSGLLVNSLLLAFATSVLGLHYLISVVIATQGSTLWNFALTDKWVFGDRQPQPGQLFRLLMFLAVNNAALLVRGPMIFALTAGLGMHYIVSNLISIIALTLVRYTLADKLIWGLDFSGKGQSAVHNYDIHHLLTVQSDVWLPELEQFHVPELMNEPTIRVRIGKLNKSPRQAVAAAPTNHTSPQHVSRHICYDEGIGPYGFGIDVTVDERISIIASPLLRRSPHVLYTNVVEPILRWKFVEMGYALVHAACIAFGEDAYLVTARTDTGKTTTILRILDQQRRATDQGAFLSDDLTLVCPDGRVLTYPKPLTISRHTVAAINTPLLSRRERLGLPLQSRLHSRKGRRFALWLSQTRLPVATINAVVQLLVPPPKYHVQQLVPRVKLAHQAQLAGLFIIERGGEGDLQLDECEGIDILMRNCEDAYGFPPYPVLEGFLHDSHGRNLQAEERAIVAAALSGQPTILLRSTTMDWSQRIATYVNPSEQPALERSVGGSDMAVNWRPA